MKQKQTEPQPQMTLTARRGIADRNASLILTLPAILLLVIFILYPIVLRHQPDEVERYFCR